MVTCKLWIGLMGLEKALEECTSGQLMHEIFLQGTFGATAAKLAVWAEDPPINNPVLSIVPI
jgi:hypothetical protein